MDRSKIMMPSLSECKTVPQFLKALKKHSEIFKSDPEGELFGQAIKMVTDYSEGMIKKEKLKQ